MARVGDVWPKLAHAQAVRAHVLTCARFSQWPFSTPAHSATYAQLTLVLAALRQDDDDEQKRLPDRYWQDWRDRMIAKMHNGPS